MTALVVDAADVDGGRNLPILSPYDIDLYFLGPPRPDEVMGGLDNIIARLELLMLASGLSIPRGPHGWCCSGWPRILETASVFERYVYGVVLSRDALLQNGVRALATTIEQCISTSYSEMPEFEALVQFREELSSALVDRRIGVVVQAVTQLLSISPCTRVVVFVSLRSQAHLIAESINRLPEMALTFFGGSYSGFEEATTLRAGDICPPPPTGLGQRCEMLDHLRRSSWSWRHRSWP